MVLTNQYYIHQTDIQLGPPILSIGGAAAKSPKECADACVATPGCDFTSWHGAQPGWVNHVTCWLKQLNSNRNCSIIANADFEPGAYLLVKRTRQCAHSLLQIACV